MELARSHVGFDLDSLEALRFSRPRDMISLHRFVHRLGYSVGRLEEICRLPAGSARANPFNRRMQAFMRATLDVVALQMLRVADLDAAITWFKSQAQPEHAGLTPEELVAGGREKALLDSLRH